jgi:hypothetical protein
VLLIVSAAARAHSAFAHPLIYVLIVVVVVLILFLRTRWPWNRRNAARPPQKGEPLGPGNPGNLSPGVRAWRRRRAAAGKGDNWLTRPLIRIDSTRDSPVQVPPDDGESDRGKRTGGRHWRPLAVCPQLSVCCAVLPFAPPVLVRNGARMRLTGPRHHRPFGKIKKSFCRTEGGFSRL